MQTHHQSHGIIIVGGGYAGLSCAQHVRELDPNVKIIILNQEPFCSRPNLFFRFKFPHWHEKHLDYSAGIITDQECENSLPRKLNISFLDGYSALKVNVEQNRITVFDKNTQEIREMEYDSLCLALGGVPNVVKFPLPQQQITDHSRIFKNKSVTYHKYVQDVENMITVRNIDDIQFLYSSIRELHDSNENVNRNIFILGSGALCLDIVTHILDGYELIYNHHNKKDELIGNLNNSKFQQVAKEIIWNIDDIKMEKLPKLTILSRRSTIGDSLLKDNEAAIMITDMIVKKDEEFSKFRLSHYLDIITNDNVDSIVVHNGPNNRNICVAVKMSSGKQIDCSIIIQAVGVICNTKLIEDSQIKIGAKDGIMVNENFQCISKYDSKPLSNIFAIGDCAELSARYVGGGIDDKESLVWKNWTSAREQAIECAKAIVHSSNTKSRIWFNQTLKLFGLHVACLGMYHHKVTTEAEPILVLKNIDPQNKRYMKLVFHKIEDDRRLIGALIIGPNIADFRIGVSVLDCLQQEMAFTHEFASQMLNLNSSQWATLVKLLKENKKNNILKLSTEQEKQVLLFDDSGTKKKNPLLAKKGVKKNPLLAKKAADKKLEEELNQKLSKLQI
jgi:NADH dehydrogenase FAD-containing subunit